jgi:hypothetical protein
MTPQVELVQFALSLPVVLCCLDVFLYVPISPLLLELKYVYPNRNEAVAGSSRKVKAGLGRSCGIGGWGSAWVGGSRGVYVGLGGGRGRGGRGSK